ncbi:antigen identified by monoclonal antibody Ki-67 [Lunasporangiospora selenospora]|uniref:Antigen identified by monoclonal antibody Ki-67 n=1 Tax=Lunasporangiospora selenospora TaxID=979761 RepID=A0A9P6KGN7_9FUNG|nr:antigen identified by monoclonal antibody Ki-67 [Lunasporangiospora selenospora]
MSEETPTKSPGRRLLRKSALQASPFGAPIKSFHAGNSSSGGNGGSKSSISNTTPSISTSYASTTSVSSPNPFLLSPSAAPSTELKCDLDVDDVAMPDSPSSRRSARLSNTHINYNYNTNGYSNIATNATAVQQCANPISILSPRKQGLHASTMPLPTPTTPKKKTRLGVWGQVVGLKKQDESVYYRYPIDKSYCSFGRSRLNDVSVQIDSVSENHCKLIRRDDGEVWLKDTSTNGTLLNNVLVHDTARPIHHNDLLTIGGRKFRFECVETSITLGSKSAGKRIGDIQLAIENDIKSLETLSSTSDSASSSTPQRRTSVAQTAVSLDASLGFFTPKKAARLSSLLVSPKPVPLPAFLAKSPSKLGSSAPRRGLAFGDGHGAHKSALLGSGRSTLQQSENDPNNPFLDSSSSTTPATISNELLHPGLLTPTRGKRTIPEEFDEDLTRTPKKVSFGPALSPEIFDQSNPPSTPVRRGQQQDPDTPRRNGVSTPLLLSRLQAVDSPSKSILSPSKSRQTHIVGLERPAPINFLSPGPRNQSNSRLQEQGGSSPTAIRGMATQDAKVSAFLASPSASSRLPSSSALLSATRSPQLSRQGSAILGSGGVVSMSGFLTGTSQNRASNTGSLGSLFSNKNPSAKGVNDNRGNDIGLWKKLTPLEVTAKEVPDASLASSMNEEEEGSNESTPPSPTKAKSTALFSIPTTPSRHGAMSPNVMLQEHTHHAVKLKTSSSTLDDKESSETQDEQPSVTPIGTAPSTPMNRTPSPSPSVVASNPLYSGDNNPFDVGDDEQDSEYRPESTWTTAVRQELAPPHISLQDLDDSDSVVNTPTHRSGSSLGITRESSLDDYKQKIMQSHETRQDQEEEPEQEEDSEQEEGQHGVSIIPLLTSPSPVSPSRIALLQLSAQKIQGLADLLHSPPSKQISRETGSETTKWPRLSLSPVHRRERVDDPLSTEVDVNKRTSDVDAEDEDEGEGPRSKADNKTTTTTLTTIDLNFGRVSLPVTPDAKKRRLSAPGALTTTQGPTLFSGLRGVFRTPQRIFAGFRNLVRTTPVAPTPTTAADEARQEGEGSDDEEAPPSPLARKSVFQQPQGDLGVTDENMTLQSSESATEGASSSKSNFSASTLFTTPLSPPRRRHVPHQDMMAILLGRGSSSTKESSSSGSTMPKSSARDSTPETSSPFAALLASTSLENLRSRGRRTDTFPQESLAKSRDAKSSYLYSAGEEGAEDEERRKRRRTMSGFNTGESDSSAQNVFNDDASFKNTTRVESSLSRPQNTTTTDDAAVGTDEANSENDGQAELLRLLDDQGNEDSDTYAYDDDEPVAGEEEEVDGQTGEDESETRFREEEDVIDGARTPPPVGSTTPTSSPPSTKPVPLTPIRRRTPELLSRRLGSASPAFRRYERVEGEDEDGEEAEDDMVVMLSPKQVRVRSIFGNRR